jgi:cell division transport system permease protein
VDLVGATIYLRSNITDAEQRRVEAAIGAVPGVSEIAYESSQQAYERFKAQFADAPDLVAATRPDSLPASYRFRLPRTGAGAAVNDLSTLPGVSDVLIGH